MVTLTSADIMALLKKNGLEPDKVEFEDRVVGIIEARDGTIMDVVRQIKEI